MATNAERNALNALVNLCESEQERNYVSMAKFFDDLFTVFNSDNNVKTPSSVDSSYTGIHLNEVYEEGDFLKLIEQFRNNKMLHPKYAMQIVNDAIKHHKRYSNISNCNLANSSLPGCILVGDLHGSFKDLYHIIEKFGVPGKNFGFVFNGDYVDRGPQQCEVLLTILYAFNLYPNRVFLNRGNHEDLSLNMSSHFAPNFQKDCMLKFNQYGNEFFKLAQEFFRYLPIATVVTNKADYKCFVIHGGVSDRTNLSFVSSPAFKRSDFAAVTIKSTDSSEKLKQAEQFTDLLWSDPLKPNTKPYNSRNGCFPNKNRGIGYLFGEDISEKFCKEYKFDIIVRSHEVRQEGYSVDHPYCCTIFSCSNYCNGTNKAAVLILNQTEKKLDVYKFVTNFLDNDSYIQQKDYLLAAFKSYIESQRNSLLQKFQELDPHKKGWIKIEDWANIISEHIAKESTTSVDAKHLIELKDNLLPCNERLGLAKYSEMFKTKTKTRESLEFLETIFSIIDKDQSGNLSKSEASLAVQKMNSILGTNYTVDFITSMDKNRDGLIDIKEFKESFVNTFDLI